MDIYETAFCRSHLVQHVPSIRFARMPTLFANADASSIESFYEMSCESNNVYRHLRVVMTMALPTEILLSVSHISRFILASMPVENSSMSITGGFPGRSIVKYGQCSSYNNNSIPISAIAKDSFR